MTRGLARSHDVSPKRGPTRFIVQVTVALIYDVTVIDGVQSEIDVGINSVVRAVGVGLDWSLDIGEK